MTGLTLKDLAFLPVPLDPLTGSWISRVVANGGSTPTASTNSAIDTMIKTLRAAGLHTAFVYLLVFVPDSLIAAITPVLFTAGNDPAVNHNFVLGDLTINGLVGNGTTKYLDSGCIPFTCFPSDASASIGVYVSNIPAAESRVEGGVQGAVASSGFEMYANFNGLEEFDCWSFGSTAIGTLPSNTTGGYMCGSLVAGNNTVFFANSTNVHSALATHAAAGNRIATFPVFFFCTNVTGTPTIPTTKRLSVAWLSLSVTAAESLKIFNAFQACRVALGGGSV